MRFASLAFVVAGFLLIPANGPAQSTGSPKAGYPTFGTIERKDPRFDKLVPHDAVIEKLAEGYDWSEGPIWVKKGATSFSRTSPKTPYTAGNRAKRSAYSSSRAAIPGASRAVANPGPTASLSTPKAASSSANTATDASPASETMGSRSSPWLTDTKGIGSTAPTTSSSNRTAISTSPTLPTASSKTTPIRPSRFRLTVSIASRRPAW